MVSDTANEPMKARRKNQITALTRTIPSSMLCDTVLQRRVDQPRAVVEGDDAHARSAARVLISSTTSCSAISTVRGFSPRRSKHRPLDRVDGLVARHRPAPRRVGLDHARDVAHQHRRAVARAHHGVLDVGGAAQVAAPAHHQLRFPLAQVAARARAVRRRRPRGSARPASGRCCAGARRRPARGYSFWKPPKLTTSATPVARIRRFDTTQSCQLRSSLGLW